MLSFRGRVHSSSDTLARAQMLGIRTSHVSSWSRSHRFNCAVRAAVVVLTCIVVNALMSSTRKLTQIGFHRTTESITSLRATAGVAKNENDDVCSSSIERYRWRDELDRYFEKSNDGMPAFAVVLTVNTGYFDFFVNWYAYYRNYSEQTNQILIIIAEDAIVHDKLRGLFNSSAITTIILPGYDIANDSALSEAEDYDSVGYKSLVSTRATHLLNLICSLGATANGDTKTGITIVYSDVDTVLIKNPFPYIQNLIGTYDILAAIDDHDYAGVKDYYCTGFLVIAQSFASISLLHHWEKELKSNSQLNQPLFNTLLRSTQLQIRHGGLGDVEFSPGRLYFDEWVKGGKELEREKKEKTIFVHNNYIVGHNAKRTRFEENGLWISKDKQH